MSFTTAHQKVAEAARAAGTYFFGEFAMTNFELGLLGLLEVSHG